MAQDQDKKKKADKAKKKIIDAYVSFVKKGVLFPSRADFQSRGITRDIVRHYFTNYSALRKAAKEMYPDSFVGVIDEEYFRSREYLEQTKKTVKKHKRFFITTAVNGQQIHPGFMDSVQQYCKEKDAMLILLPCHDPAHNLDNSVEWHFDKRLLNLPFVFEYLPLNSNIHISSIRITAKQINPHTGLGRFVQGKGSAIFGSPKQNLDYIPVSNVKYPHALMSTGAITLPNYNTSRGNSFRSAFIADYDHIIGGLIIEIEDDKYYHFRQVQADKAGRFIDLGLMYDGDKIEKVAGTTFILGDYHAGQHDPSAVKAWKEVAEKIGVETIVFHDLFNGLSINHHNAHKFLTRAKMAKGNRLLLQDELKITSQVLMEWKKYKRTVVKSNHDEFIDKWLEEGEFRRDPYNFQLGCKIADQVMDDLDPLIAALKASKTISDEELESIHFLKRDEDFKIAGIECGTHGDKGPNGSRGSRANLENAYGKCVIGHSHTPGILRGVFQVGTTSLFDLEYNIGPSSWMHCSCLVYPNGQRQMVNAINGHWHLAP